MGSVYVHSEAERAEMLMSEDLINGEYGINSAAQLKSFEDTINKLESIKKSLDEAAEAFLGGYSIEEAQAIADKSDDLLIQLVNRVLYGSNAYNLASALTRNQTLKGVKDLRAKILETFGKEVGSQIVGKIKQDMSTSELASLLVKELSGGETVIDVTTAGAHIEQLSGIFDVKRINTSSWRKTAVAEVGKQIFKTSKDLVTSKNGAYRKMIKSVLESSNSFSTQKMSTSVKKFCNELKKAMIEESTTMIPFIYGEQNTLEKQINDFIIKLEPALIKAFNSKEIQEKMKDKSNVTGAIGEEVRSTVTQVAENATLISFAIGGDTDEAGIEEVNKVLAQKGANLITSMKSYKKTTGQSQTDIILLNTRTNKAARAQSKNHFAAYFTNNKDDKTQIDNFRWKVEDATNLSNFITKLSSTDLGMNLSGIDLSNINTAIANNLWFSKYGSASPGVYEGRWGIVKEPVSPPDILDSFEGAMEKALAGQVTNLLGVTINVDTGAMISGGSNIFYLLNGRMKKTADLVQQAIDQIKENMVQSLNNSLTRLVVVTIHKGAIPSPKEVGSPSFLPAKLRSNSDSFGETMGEKIIDNLKITVSLGTSIEKIKQTSLIL